MTDHKTMMVVSATSYAQDGNPAGPTFRLIPISKDAPWQVAQYDTTTNSLILVTKECKMELKTVAKLDDCGEVMRKNGKVMVERRTLEEYMELIINGPEAILELINLTCINASTAISVFMPYLATIQVKDKTKMEKPSLILTPQ